MLCKGTTTKVCTCVSMGLVLLDLEMADSRTIMEFVASLKFNWHSELPIILSVYMSRLCVCLLGLM